MKTIDLFNEYYNFTCAGLPHGMPISNEHLEAISIRASIYALTHKNKKKKISLKKLKKLADQIEKQGNDYVNRNETDNKVAQETTSAATDVV